MRTESVRFCPENELDKSVCQKLHGVAEKKQVKRNVASPAENDSLVHCSLSVPKYGKQNRNIILWRVISVMKHRWKQPSRKRFTSGKKTCLMQMDDSVGKGIFYEHLLFTYNHSYA
ncbi:hypothetical protein CEXT_369841 [Caerostris extrusa]|uniref:Uncharacterized protein n=1 Tax=Caerostris extrusa TaxID=172846 RepID=A0AAV4UPA3_CAEEX|nr:hypothetical protein CEXT_369841 [Caerostris extrusa]